MTETTLLGRLEAASVPWVISASDTWLTVTAGEEQEPVVRLLADCLPDQHAEVIRVEFRGGGHVMLSPHDGRDALPASHYDWSGVPGYRRPTEDVRAWLARIQQTWADTGIHPWPGLYLVHDSAWARSLHADRRGLHHHVFVGHDVRIDVLARAFTWVSEGVRTYQAGGE